MHVILTEEDCQLKFRMCSSKFGQEGDHWRQSWATADAVGTRDRQLSSEKTINC